MRQHTNKEQWSSLAKPGGKTSIAQDGTTRTERKSATKTHSENTAQRCEEGAETLREPA